MDLNGKLALVTGASRGIGAATAEALAAAGAHVVLTARTEAALIEVEDRIHAAGGTATIAPLDLRDGDAIDRLAAALLARWGKLDVLVLNAATLGSLTPVPHIDLKEWEQVVGLNLTANWRLVRAFDPLLRASEAGPAADADLVGGDEPARLLGSLCGDQGGTRHAGADLRCRGRQHDAGARRSRQSRRDRDTDARAGVSGRGRSDAQRARGSRRRAGRAATRRFRQRHEGDVLGRLALRLDELADHHVALQLR